MALYSKNITVTSHIIWNIKRLFLFIISLTTERRLSQTLLTHLLTLAMVQNTDYFNKITLVKTGKAWKWRRKVIYSLKWVLETPNLTCKGNLVGGWDRNTQLGSTVWEGNMYKTESMYCLLPFAYDRFTIGYKLITFYSCK